MRLICLFKANKADQKDGLSIKIGKFCSDEYVLASVDVFLGTLSFFVSDDGMRISYHKHFDKQLIPEIEKLASRKD